MRYRVKNKNLTITLEQKPKDKVRVEEIEMRDGFFKELDDKLGIMITEDKQKEEVGMCIEESIEDERYEFLGKSDDSAVYAWILLPILKNQVIEISAKMRVEKNPGKLVVIGVT